MSTFTGFNSFAQQKRWASHGYRKVETKIADHNDSEKSGRLVERIDRKGRILESWEWNEKDRLAKHIVNIYSNRKFQSNIYSGNDSLKSTEIIEFDQKGRKVRQYFSDKKKGKDEEILTEFNKWGNKSKERVIKNNLITLVKTYFYNNEGLLEKQIHYDSEGKIVYEKSFHYFK